MIRKTCNLARRKLTNSDTLAMEDKGGNAGLNGVAYVAKDWLAYVAKD